MSRLLRALRSLRIDLLALTLPYAIIWAQTSHSGGVVMAVAFSLLVLLFALSLDLNLLTLGMDPRVSTARDRFQFNVELVERARSLLLAAVAVVALVLVFVQWGLAVFVLLAAVATVVFLRDGIDRAGARRLLLAEWLWPLGMLLTPMAIIGLWQWSDRQSGSSASPGSALALDAAAVGATFLGALLLAGFVLASLMRSENADRAAGLKTTPSAVGRPAAEASLFLILGAAVILSIAGVAAGWWGFWAAALCSACAMLTLWTISHGLDTIAPTLMWSGAVATGIVVALSVIQSPQESAMPDRISDLIREAAPVVSPEER